MAVKRKTSTSTKKKAIKTKVESSGTSEEEVNDEFVTDIKEEEHVDVAFTEDDVIVYEEIEAIRKKFDMYAGIDPAYHMIKEGVDNGVDEHMNGYGNTMKVIVDTKENSCIIRDFGRGLPLGMHKKEKKPTIEVLFTKVHSSGKFTKNVVKTSGGKNGVGIKIINALSETLIATSYRDIEDENGNKIGTEKGVITFSKGKVKEKLKVTKLKKPVTSGTELYFIPDKAYLEKELGKGKHLIDVNKLREELRLKCYLNKKLTIKFTIDGKTEVISYKNGLIDYVNNHNDTPLKNMEAFSYSGADKNGDTYEIAFAYNSGRTENIVSFVNSIPTSAGGSHEKGFKRSLTRTFKTYITNNGFLTRKDKDLNITGEDVRRGLVCIISLHSSNPIYNGQVKDMIESSVVDRAIDRITTNGINEFLSKNPKTAKAICERIIQFARATNAKDKEIKKIETISQSNLGLELSNKFMDCETDDPRLAEIYIVEGDSAKGGAEEGRFPEFQCIYALKGKIKNTHNLSNSGLISNNEINEFLKIEFGTNDMKKIHEVLTAIVEAHRDGTLLEKPELLSSIKSTKIFILTDSDEDGKHITMLFINFIYEHLPELIELGWLYIGLSPFYRVLVNKNWRYFMNNREYGEFIAETISNKYTVIDCNYEMSELLGRADIFREEFKRIMEENSIDPDILSVIFREDDIEEIYSYITDVFGLVIYDNGDVDGLYNDAWMSFNIQDVITETDELLEIYDPELVTLTIYNNSTGEEDVYDLFEGLNLLMKSFTYKRNRIKG